MCKRITNFHLDFVTSNYFIYTYVIVSRDGLRRDLKPKGKIFILRNRRCPWTLLSMYAKYNSFL